MATYDGERSVLSAFSLSQVDVIHLSMSGAHVRLLQLVARWGCRGVSRLSYSLSPVMLGVLTGEQRPKFFVRTRYFRL